MPSKPKQLTWHSEAWRKVAKKYPRAEKEGLLAWNDRLRNMLQSDHDFRVAQENRESFPEAK